MKTALVFGGTRFFGVNLVNELLKKGFQVTVATRQNSTIPFGDEVKKLKVDRFDKQSVITAVQNSKWDIVFDQICYNAQGAEITIEALKGKVGKYVFTSTMSVYDYGVDMTEDVFDPYTYEINHIPTDEISYQEGKRQAEAAFFQHASFPAVAVRIPIVLGEHDYTERLKLHIDKVKKQEQIYFPNLDVEMGFINQQEAGEFIAWTGTQDFVGPINACADGTISMGALMELIEKEIGKNAVLSKESTKDDHSPYGIEETWTISTDKAKGLGYTFTNLYQWLPNLIKTIANEK
ncbi:NAD-dependent epimerase/dehydratase family protein [Cytobacillus sp. Hm23]